MSQATLHSAAHLLEAGLISADRLAAIEQVGAHYAIAITPQMAELINPADPQDPIARQFVPDELELQAQPHELSDPIGDAAHSPVEGIVHRYPDRVLLKLLQVCPIYCRFCFRREMVGPGENAFLSAEAVTEALNYISSHQEIWEVILTGGDPLALSPRRLKDVMRRLGQIDHVKVVRIHTRVPAVDSARISDELIEALKASGKTLFVALHANHARELTPVARAACAKIIAAGLPMVSQSVLLRGVNDSLLALSDLMRAFVETGIKPYYLHHGDLAPGTAHLRTSLEEGLALMQGLRGTISGLCQPTYVLDIPGGHGKAVLEQTHAQANGADEVRLRDFRGQEHGYRDARDHK